MRIQTTSQTFIPLSLVYVVMTTKNLVLITIDCLRYDRCGFNGYNQRNTTPTLDKIANESYILNNAFATGPWTSESFPGILGGRLPSQSSYQGNISLKSIPEGETTLASHLKENGYNTIGVATNPNLTEKRNFDQGFDRYINLRTFLEEKDMGGDDSASLIGKIGDNLSRQFDFSDRVQSLPNTLIRILEEKETAATPYHISHALYHMIKLNNWTTIRGSRVVKELLKGISEESSNSRFFAWGHFMDLHGPIHPHVAPETGGESKTGRYLLSNASQISNVNSAIFDELYDHALRYVDAKIGEVVDELKRMNIWDDTALVVTADHGQALGERGIYGHPYHYMYNELLRVPLLIRTPTAEGKRIANPFSLGWLHEVISDILGLPRSSLPLASGVKNHLVSTSNRYSPAISESISSNGRSISVQTQYRKAIKNDVEGGKSVSQQGIYDLETDPNENFPIDEKRSSEVVSTIADNIFEQTGIFDKETAELDEGIENRLEQLGYKL